MTDPRERRLVDLALQMDEQLAGNASEGGIDHASSELTHEQLEELQRAGRALAFLQGMRQNADIAGTGEAAAPRNSSDYNATLNAAADDTAVGRVLKDTSVTDEAPLRNGEPASKLGRFEIIDVLGQGGFSRVFLARDPQLERLVALKVPLPQSLADEPSRRRFQREARAAAILSHPAIVPIYESGSLGAVDYIAFGYCPGLNLGEWFANRNRSVPHREAAEIVARLAEATEHAHQRGIVHRDLKPANVLIEMSEDMDAAGPGISAENLAGRIRIADFGLARLEAHEESLTLDGAVVGTPAYMSPEQARGERDVTASSDVYSLGTILYELLTGRLPFYRQSHLATLRAIEADQPQPPRQIQAQIPKDLEAICLKCLRKSPADRYASAHELAADLERWLAGVPILARPATTLEKGLGWARRNPLVAGALTFALVALTAGLSVALWQRHTAVKNLAEAVRQTQRADEHLKTTQAMIFDIANLERQLRHHSEFADLREKVVRRAAQLQLDLMDREFESSELKYNGAMVLKELSPLLIQMGEEDLAIKNIHRVLSLLDGIEAELPGNVSYRSVFVTRTAQRLNLAGILQRRGQFEEAVRLYEENFNERLPPGAAPHQRAIFHAENLRSQGELYRNMDDDQAAVDVLSRGLELLSESGRPDDRKGQWDHDLTACRLHGALSIHLFNLERRQAAVEQLQRAQGYVPQLQELFPDSPHVTEIAGATALKAAAISRRSDDPQTAVEHYRAGHLHYAKLHDAMPDFTAYPTAMMAANSKIVSMLLRIDNYAEATAEAQRSLQEFASFPEKMQALPPIAEHVEQINLDLQHAQSALGDTTGIPKSSLIQ